MIACLKPSDTSSVGSLPAAFGGNSIMKKTFPVGQISKSCGPTLTWKTPPGNLCQSCVWCLAILHIGVTSLHTSSHICCAVQWLHSAPSQSLKWNRYKLKTWIKDCQVCDMVYEMVLETKCLENWRTTTHFHRASHINPSQHLFSDHNAIMIGESYCIFLPHLQNNLKTLKFRSVLRIRSLHFFLRFCWRDCF